MLLPAYRILLMNVEKCLLLPHSPVAGMPQTDHFPLQCTAPGAAPRKTAALASTPRQPPWLRRSAAGSAPLTCLSPQQHPPYRSGWAPGPPARAVVLPDELMPEKLMHAGNSSSIWAHVCRN